MLDQVRNNLDPETPEEPESTLNKPVFFISAGLIIAVCLYGALFSEHASLLFSDLQSWLLTNLGWLYMGSVAGFFYASDLSRVQPIWASTTRCG